MNTFSKSDDLHTAVLTMATEYDPEQTPRQNAAFIMDHGGCDTGAIGSLIYHSDCNEFYRIHKTEISTIVMEHIEECGFSSQQHADMIESLLDGIYTPAVWLAVELTLMQIADE